MTNQNLKFHRHIFFKYFGKWNSHETGIFVAERPSTSQDPRQSILIAQSERWSLHPGNYSPREGVQFIQPALESVLDVQGHQTKSPLRRLEKVCALFHDFDTLEGLHMKL